ncbi:hypothetical protein BDQ94DRAFT_91528 [Aspergillus welwitschiae]|uniref:Uncharacterized protein n=1 Tax=Aspergillus welwitschiae TaxID=1341132 RepID=A0A3F3QED9_9EURO|nr:hypothetical protein BDQ94DRAFT_91528 [Aspergillus welwitschiae]RDH37621.1 hypothetical protein BDQ94DRAFT_91528 [Aspergillus welwitschiae]
MSKGTCIHPQISISQVIDSIIRIHVTDPRVRKEKHLPVWSEAAAATGCDWPGIQSLGGYWLLVLFFLFHPRLNRRRPSRPPVSAVSPLPVTNANWDPRCIVNNQSCYYAVLIIIIIIITQSAAMVRLFASRIDQLLL